MNFSIALAQIDPVLGDVPRNMQKHVEVAQKAKDQGAQLVVFPELSLTGYSVKDMNWDLAINLERDTSPVAELLELSKSVSLLAGGIEEDSTFSIYNSAFLFEDGKVSSVHRKTFPPTYGLFEEMRYFARGRTVRCADTKYGRLGVLICEDLWHISLPYLLAHDGAQVIITLVASPTRMGPNEQQLQAAAVNLEQHKAYARLLSTYIVFCNRVGFEDGINFWGGSDIVGPDGEVVVRAKLFEEDMIIARIDANEVRRARRFSRHFLDDDPGLTLKELQRIYNNR
jgi:predicted amidohydrolase